MITIADMRASGGFRAFRDEELEVLLTRSSPLVRRSGQRLVGHGPAPRQGLHALVAARH